ncbi:MAG TPA: type IV toxin-antitoxin system AbiEi family antitoxin domain-containing protein [Mycobacteriales bacterium]|nr:type IV toxin-antitoxin system AbiEi family antitoxin domain-containing protein [Mycobacteriales bacterium]
MDPRLAKAVQRQGGAISRRQARAAGWSRTLSRREDAGEWRDIGNGVLVPSTVVVDDELARVATELTLQGPWGFAGLTGLAILKLPVKVEGAPRVAVGPGGVRKRIFGITPTRISDDELAGRRRINGHIVLAPAVLIRQAAAEISEDQLTTVVEAAVRRRLVTLADLRAVCGRGKRGSARLSRLLDVLTADGVDRWARVLIRALRKAGLDPEAQFWLTFEGRSHPFDVRASSSVVVEVDDWETHGLINTQDKDREQDRWARRAGLFTLRTTPREVRDRLTVVVRDVVDEVARAGG